jgi:uncharacterized membrane protein (DUF4010 family)
MNGSLELAVTFVTSALIGLLVGLERERNPLAKAGVRTFTLIAVAGALASLLAQASGSDWMLGIGALIVGVTVAGAFLADRSTAADDFGTTTVIAALVVYSLGALNAYGNVTLAVAVGIGITALLHFKAELEDVAHKLTPVDIRSMLQFGALSAIVLPLLPDEPMGPLGVWNPFHLWLMVVLISGVSLAGYIAWRFTPTRRGLLLTGALGGLVSSTATTLVYARQARAGTASVPAARLVILLANATMLLRVLVIALVLAPVVAAAAGLALLPALLGALPALWRGWRASLGQQVDAAELYRNPTQLPLALLFGAGYALVLLVAAWVAGWIGTTGLYGLAVLSGLTDVDAITLSALQLFNTQAVVATAAGTAIALAVGANLLLKLALATGAGGATLGRSVARALAGPLVGLAVGLVLLHRFGPVWFA